MSAHSVALRLMFGAVFVASIDAADHASSTRFAFEWPDPDTKGTVLVNVTEDIIPYLRNHPEWFFNGELVLTFSVPIGPDRAVPERQYQQLRELLKSKGLIVGTYISGTTVKPEAELTRWPYGIVPSEWLSGPHRFVGLWPNDSHRKIIDVADAATRRALQAGIRREWQAHPAPVRFVDNAAAHSSAGGTQSWDAQCAHIREIKEIGESLRCRVAFNIALHVGSLSDREASLLIQAVGPNCILLEDPWTPWVRRHELESKKAEARYRQLLDSGMAIIMLPLNVPEDALEQWVHSWSKPAYHIYFGGAFYKRPTHGVRIAPPPG